MLNRYSTLLFVTTLLLFTSYRILDPSIISSSSCNSVNLLSYLILFWRFSIMYRDFLNYPPAGECSCPGRQWPQRSACSTQSPFSPWISNTVSIQMEITVITPWEPDQTLFMNRILTLQSKDVHAWQSLITSSKFLRFHINFHLFLVYSE